MRGFRDRWGTDIWPPSILSRLRPLSVRGLCYKVLWEINRQHRHIVVCRYRLPVGMFLKRAEAVWLSSTITVLSIGHAVLYLSASLQQTLTSSPALTPLGTDHNSSQRVYRNTKTSLCDKQKCTALKNERIHKAIGSQWVFNSHRKLKTLLYFIR